MLFGSDLSQDSVKEHDLFVVLRAAERPCFDEIPEVSGVCEFVDESVSLASLLIRPKLFVIEKVFAICVIIDFVFRMKNVVCSPKI